MEPLTWFIALASAVLSTAGRSSSAPSSSSSSSAPLGDPLGDFQREVSREPSSASSAAVPLEGESLAREQLAREQLEEPALQGEVIDSPESAARKLHRIATTTQANARGPLREFIRAMQTIIGVTPDGLIGREVARRVLALTGLRIPGLT